MTEPIEIPAALSGERLDKVLAMLLERPRRHIADLIEAEGVSIAGKVIRTAHHKVAVGDVLLIDDDVIPEDPAERSIEPSADVKFEVVFADETVIVIDKPAGLVVHPGAGHLDDTLVSGLLYRFPDLQDWDEEVSDPDRPGIVHRLDKDTSGLLVVARTPAAYTDLVGQLQRRDVHRQYRSVVLGHLGAVSGTIDAPIGRSERRKMHMAVTVAGRPAITHYKVERRFSAPIAASEVEVTLESGRTHQIRVHFSAIGHPVLGDQKYGGNDHDLVLDRPFLHAERLAFTHPATKEIVTFDSALPVALTDVFARCS